jgi:hypothetical protein
MAVVFALHLRRVDEQALRLLLALQQALLLAHALRFLSAHPSMAAAAATAQQVGAPATAGSKWCHLPAAAAG